MSVASTYVSRAAYAPSVRVASTVFSEAEQAESSETVVNEAPAFETAIYVGNISFGKFASLPFRNIDSVVVGGFVSHPFLLVTSLDAV
jgi:hypothetical protein